ncbi:holin [uncultured Nocardioides sp.]|uniref:holin n=1 Tax=uncultured Nocardioides sp. TaxID=198441 RepID=UPI00262522E8|nr:holin [uncultured Nocardioides sp.]
MSAVVSRAVLLAFVLAMLERAIKTAAQVFLAVAVSGATGVTDLDWAQVASVICLAVLASVATSLLSISLAPGSGPAAFGPEKVEP